MRASAAGTARTLLFRKLIPTPGANTAPGIASPVAYRCDEPTPKIPMMPMMIR
ncbi:hypothetical protein QFZ96_004969 [Paraburkholderia youngii]